MEAPDLELIKGCLDRLKADTRMIQLVGEAIYDRAPETKNNKPNREGDYVTVGSTTSIPANIDCMPGAEITFQLDAWSSGNGHAYGSAKVRKIADAMRRSLDGAEVLLTESALVTLIWALTVTTPDPNGVTHHAAVQFTATVETP